MTSRCEGNACVGAQQHEIGVRSRPALGDLVRPVGDQSPDLGAIDVDERDTHPWP